MTPKEWWRIYECKRPRNKETDYAGNLTQQDIDELSEMLRDS